MFCFFAIKGLQSDLQLNVNQHAFIDFKYLNNYNY